MLNQHNGGVPRSEALAEDVDHLGAREGAIAHREDEDGIGHLFEVGFADAQLAAVHHHADFVHPLFEALEALGSHLLVALALGANTPDVFGKADKLVQSVVHHMAIVRQ